MAVINRGTSPTSGEEKVGIVVPRAMEKVPRSLISHQHLTEKEYIGISPQAHERYADHLLFVCIWIVFQAETPSPPNSLGSQQDELYLHLDCMTWVG